MKYGELNLGQIEALLNKLGGMDVVLDILRGSVEVVTKVVSYLVATSKQTVNYDRSVADSLKAGKYDWTNSDITDENFPSTEKGKREVEFGMFHFNKTMGSEDIIAKMKLEGFRPATMKEKLAYGEKNPEEQRKHPIVALGSVAKLNGDRRVGCLLSVGSGRYADLRYFDNGWGGGCRCLAVRI